MMKRCCSCKETKDAKYYWKDRSRKDGLEPRCIGCSKKHGKVVYEKWRPTEEYRAKKRAEEARYRERYPERQRAHALARKNKSKIMKDSCESCGIRDRLHMHHPDYSKPLQVVTLCLPCHELTHHKGVTV